MNTHAHGTEEKQDGARDLFGKGTFWRIFAALTRHENAYVCCLGRSVLLSPAVTRADSNVVSAPWL